MEDLDGFATLTGSPQLRTRKEIDEKDLADRIEAALFDEFFGETGVVTINVEKGYIKQVLVDLAKDEEDD